jgi:hypothetical protein
MAEGLLRRDAGDRFEVETAGTKPSIVRDELRRYLSDFAAASSPDTIMGQ